GRQDAVRGRPAGHGFRRPAAPLVRHAGRARSPRPGIVQVLFRAGGDGSSAAALPAPRGRRVHGPAAVVAPRRVAPPARPNRPHAARARSAARRRARRGPSACRESHSPPRYAPRERRRHVARFVSDALARACPGGTTATARAAVDGCSRVRMDGLLCALRAPEQPVATVRRWVIAGALGCAIVALAYLPPRGA